MTMTKNRNESICGSGDFGKEIDPQSLGHTQNHLNIDTNVNDSCEDKIRGKSRDENGLYCELEKEVLAKNAVHEIKTGRHENLTESIKSSTANQSETMGENDCISSEEGDLRSNVIRVKELQNDEFSIEPSDKNSCGTPACENSNASLAETGVSKNHFQTTGHEYKSEVADETITFNFDSSMLFDKNIAVTENITKQAADHDRRVSYNASDSGGEQDSKTSPQCIGSKTEFYISQRYHAIPEHSPAEGEGNLSSTNSQSLRKEDIVVLPKNEVRNKGNISLASHLLRDEGEASFSAASLSARSVSGSIPYSGSLRSDASTTSAQSFAFPILQPEWNCSPARMAKADRSHFQKQKGWRSGLLCCRF